MTAACSQNAASVGSGHTLAETVFVAALADRRLKCTFHIVEFLLFLFFGDCKSKQSKSIYQNFLWYFGVIYIFAFNNEYFALLWKDG